MGATNSAPTTAVRPELLVSELIGEVKEDDYYARATHLLDNFVMDDPTQGRFDPNDALSLEDAYKLVNPGYLNLEHGYTRMNDGTWYIACLTDLGFDVNGEMFDWWYRNCDNAETFRWWHPNNHIKGTWDPQFYSVMPQERQTGHYIDHIHIFEEILNGKARQLQIEFERPSKLFDVTQFAENGITACVVGRVYARDSSIGLVAVGHMLHMVRETNGRSELRSRFWIGNISYPETVENIIFARIVNSIASTKLFRMTRLPSSLARSLWVHTSQQMHCLREFLPHFQRAFLAKQQEEAQQLYGQNFLKEN
mmetsp:Transcript_28898/g.48511  ORF Transcript_28898/g.48511 Transcript_28898/m.48511 type:complete len:309 (+) Transcript_28898:127-1053(+)|eukprot:CAMPEP_0174973442 /NCGR_PEP_ID=MMETSP0004_2-20121128/11245_1 /TAXON_ID=420556 /ORGANISM="Ochromonas sp., Strain CCMP1393" /LENGTH=308 /DNA_ID=CAMNT_0016223893 /DNA_START=127 /DNA_END=1053 /DNA_ORIENTATION=+